MRQSSAVRIGYPKLRQKAAFKPLHLSGLAQMRMVVALCVERAVHDQMCQVLAQTLALLARLAPHDRQANDNFGNHARMRLIGKRKNVGRVVAMTKLPI